MLGQTAMHVPKDPGRLGASRLHPSTARPVRCLEGRLPALLPPRLPNAPIAYPVCVPVWRLLPAPDFSASTCRASAVHIKLPGAVGLASAASMAFTFLMSSCLVPMHAAVRLCWGGLCERMPDWLLLYWRSGQQLPKLQRWLHYSRTRGCVFCSMHQ